MNIEELVQDPLERAQLNLIHAIGKYLLKMDNLTDEEQFDVHHAIALFRQATDWPESSIVAHINGLVANAHHVDNLLNKKHKKDLQ